MMKNFQITGICALIAFAVACSEKEDPAVIGTEKLYFYTEGQNQTGFSGEYLADSIAVTIYDELRQRVSPGMKVIFSIIEGGGQVEEVSGFTDNTGKFATRWKIGAGGVQRVSASIYNSDGEYRGFVTFFAVSYILNGWNYITNSYQERITDMISDTINHVTLAIIDNNIYRRVEGFFNWEPVSNYYIATAHEFIGGNNGEYYLTSSDGSLYKSDNPGAYWEPCTSPFSQWGDYNLCITPDNYLWASTWGSPLACSRDGGLTWTKDTAVLEEFELMGDVVQLADSTFFLRTQLSRLYRSEDDGYTWNQVDAIQNVQKIYVTDQDEIIAFNGYGSLLTINKSVDKGKTFIQKHIVSDAGSFSMYHTVHKDQWYYLLIPDYGILNTTDFENFSVFWLNEEAMDMLMDADGNIVVTTFGALDGVYYFNNTGN